MNRWTIRSITFALLLASSAVGQPARGMNELGVMAFQAREYEKAIGHFEAALKLDPENPSLRRNLCAVYQAVANDLALAGKLAEALAQVETGLNHDPTNASALAQAGAYCLKLDRKEDALRHMEAAVAADPKSNEARILLGELHYEKNQLAEARTQWEAVLKESPEFPGLADKLAKLDREAMVEQDFSQDASEHFALSYAKALSEPMKANVFDILEGARQSVGGKLGGAMPESVVQVVLYDGEQFAEATGLAEHVGALFDGKIRAPITGRGGRYLDRRVLETRLTHEYVHVLLTQVGGPRTPWWLNEGLAEVFSREMDQSRRRMLRRAFTGERGLVLADLEAQQLNTLSKEALADAYAQAHATASVLWDMGGTKKLVAALGRIKKGETAEAAINAEYGLDYPALQARVKQEFGGEGVVAAQP